MTAKIYERGNHSTERFMVLMRFSSEDRLRVAGELRILADSIFRLESEPRLMLDDRFMQRAIQATAFLNNSAPFRRMSQSQRKRSAKMAPPVDGER